MKSAKNVNHLGKYTRVSCLSFKFLYLVFFPAKFQVKLSSRRGAWLASSVEHETLDLGVASSGPALGADYLQLSSRRYTYHIHSVVHDFKVIITHLERHGVYTYIIRLALDCVI